MDVAEHWGLKVTSERFTGQHMGVYYPKGKAIKLLSPEESVFYHELAHAVQDRLGILSKNKTKNELVAEFSAASLIYMDGREPRHFRSAQNEVNTDTTTSGSGLNEQSMTKRESSMHRIGSSYEYLKHYAEAVGKKVEKAVIPLTTDISQVINAILKAVQDITAKLGPEIPSRLEDTWEKDRPKMGS